MLGTNGDAYVFKAPRRFEWIWSFLDSNYGRFCTSVTRFQKTGLFAMFEAVCL